MNMKIKKKITLKQKNPAVVAWSVKASTQIQVELDFAGGGSNPAWV